METLVNDIAKTASKLLGRDDLAAFFEGAEDAENVVVGADAQLMLTSVCLSAQEIAEEYFPLETNETVNSDEYCRLNFSDFDGKVHKVIAVYDSTGESCTFRTFDDFIKVSAPNAAYVVYYDKVPDVVGINENVEHSAKVSDRILAYGACSHFCLCSLLYTEARMWSDRYSDALDQLRFEQNNKRKVRKKWRV